MTDPIHVFYLAMGWTVAGSLAALVGGLALARWATRPIPEDHRTKR